MWAGGRLKSLNKLNTGRDAGTSTCPIARKGATAMSLYCIYLTIYLGDNLPPFYIGSSTVEKVLKGYHGTVTSAKYKDIWRKEIQTNRHLFKTFMIPSPPILTMTDKLMLEAKWQLEFDVVNSPLFINQRIADRKLFSNSPESIAKGKLKRAQTFKARNINELLSVTQIGRKLWNNGIIQTFSHVCPGQGWVLGATEACRKKNSEGQLKRPPCADATREKHRQARLGSKSSHETVEKIRQARLGTNRSPETCSKISSKRKGQSPWNKGKKTGQMVHNAKQVTIISPSGELFEYASMRQACIAHNLSTASMCNVRQGKQDNYKGWKVVTKMA